MKKLIALTLGLILITEVGYAQTSISADRKITKVEVRPDTAELVLDTVRILYFTKTLELTYRKIDSNGNSTGEEVKKIFTDIKDSPDTPEDETKTEFTDLMKKIPGIEKVLKTAMEDKLKVK